MKIHRIDLPVPKQAKIIRPKPEKSTLTPAKRKKYIKVKRFVEEYLIDLNATKAYQRCGYGTTNHYSDSVASAKLLNRPDVVQLIHESEEARTKRVEITHDMVVKELSLIAFSNLKKIAQWDIDGIKLKGSEELTMDECVCISEISQQLSNFGSSLKVKMYDKKAALIDLGKHLGMFWEDSSRTKDATEEANKIRIALLEIDRVMDGS